MRLMRFSKIKSLYKDYYRTFYTRGDIPLRDTKLGMWGVSSAQDVFEIFQKLAIDDDFIDLGSGDGKVVLIASLFADSVSGVECDEELVNASKEFADKLGIDAEFILNDYLSLDLSGYDWLFLNPDHKLDELENKLLRELNGKVIVHSNLYQFKRLKKVNEFAVSGIKVIVYAGEKQETQP